MTDAQKHAEALENALAEFPKGWGSAFTEVLAFDVEAGTANVGDRYEDGDPAPVIFIDTGEYYDDVAAGAIGRFLAAANPPAIRALLDERKKLLKAIHDARPFCMTIGAEILDEALK